MGVTLWRFINGYEGLYKINEFGQILSLKQDKINGRLLKPRLAQNGYLTINLYNAYGKRKTYSIHRLVAETFIPNIHEKPEINHIDEIKTNNHINNLEWVTPKENCNHGTRIKRVTMSIDYKVVSEKNSKSIFQLDKNNNVIRVWNSTRECMLETGFDNSNIIKCCRNKMKTAYGFKWRYA